MAILHLKNKETWDRVWIDARLSNTGTPFDELISVEGFPRWILRDEELDIEMGDWKELLYRRNYTTADLSNVSDLYRIGMHGRSNVVNGYVWATQIRQTFEHKKTRAELGMGHWFVEDSPGIHRHLMNKCGVDKNQIESARTEITAGTVKPKILLSKKVRTARHYLIEPYLKIDGYDSANRPTCQVYVTLTDQRTGIAGTKLIIESNADEALSLIDSFVIKNENLEAKPRNTMYGYSCAETYRSRGFRVPISEQLSNFFGGWRET